MAIRHEEITKLWHAHASALTLLARTRCNAAEDCVQEAYVKLAKLEELPREPIAWLSQVVRHEAISNWRSEHRRQQREVIAVQNQQQWFASADSDRCDPIDHLALQQALENLDVDDREILVAHIWTGLTFRQIAELTELPLTQVHRRYTAAMQRLKLEIDASNHSAAVPT
jgi:RNA polymerase sigma-70 factor (ECF subfamily)